MNRLHSLAAARRTLMLGLAMATVACLSPALALPRHTEPKPLKGPYGLKVMVENNSSTCVWVSVAYATFVTPWNWMTDAHNTARFIRPHEKYEFQHGFMSPLPFPHPLEVKVEGTFMEHANCSGKHAREITAENKGINPSMAIGKANAYLTGDNPGSYSVKIYNQ
jgi:hypothetical protein